MIIGEVLKEAIARLKVAGIEDPQRDARKILRSVIHSESGTIDPSAELSATEADRFFRGITEREAWRPVSQIIGVREFWGREFFVTQDTLDPRPDSELIIEKALELANPQKILDLGTGTGCLLLTLLAEFPSATGLGVDVSEAALDVAQKNANSHGLSNKATFQKSDWFEEVTGKFDLIVCNPPYISEMEFARLDKEVKNWEPKFALTPGGDGLLAYREISNRLTAHLTEDGIAIFEFGFSQGNNVKKIFSLPEFTVFEVAQDLNGKDRAIIIRKPK